MVLITYAYRGIRRNLTNPVGEQRGGASSRWTSYVTRMTQTGSEVLRQQHC